MTLDADVVRGRCTEIERALDRLARIRAAGRAAFLVDPDAKDIGCYRLLLAIEAALALCYHVSARRLKRVPDDYAGCFAGRRLDSQQRRGNVGPSARTGKDARRRVRLHEAEQLFPSGYQQLSASGGDIE